MKPCLLIPIALANSCCVIFFPESLRSSNICFIILANILTASHRISSYYKGNLST
nr:MAG TPA: hypothetical protein [Caudoviricetes sp.]